MLPAASSRCCFSAARGSHAIRRLCLSNRKQYQKAWSSKATMATSASPSPSSAQPLPFGPVFFLDSFALRQWSETASGTRFDPQEVSLQSVVDRVHAAHAAGSPLVDGYAPFCKHVFIENFTSAAPGCLEITDENRHLVRSGYTSRRPEELAVLSRWFEEGELLREIYKGKPLAPAKFLDVILYSREQLEKERAAMPSKEDQAHPLPPPGETGPQWGIISLKAQDESHETPMQPITAMRNALGRDQGGSGVPLDKAKYDEAVEYWRERAAIVRGSPSGE